MLCVQYWITGDLTDDILQGDFQYAFQTASITDEVRMSYYSWSSYISKFILKKGLLYKIFKPFTLGWANEMASRVGVPEARPNLIGYLMCGIGVPVSHVLGKVMKWLGYTIEEVEHKKEVAQLFGEAQHLWHNAQKNALLNLGTVGIK